MFLLVPFYQSVILSLLMPKSEGKGKLIHFGVCLPEQIFQKLRLGAIPLSRNAICAIDELTAFAPEEQSRLLDVLEEGILDIDKHGRHWTIQSPTTIIATANPSTTTTISHQVQ
jgi:MoxR-like ATPase